MKKAEGRALRGLYAVTPSGTPTEALVARVKACLEGGAALVQYRAKGIPPGMALVQARALLQACREAGVPLIVNDSIELAAAAGADGVHLGREDATVREARICLPHGVIGVSCYDDPERARAAAREGADYVAIGSVFPSGTKPGAVRAPLALIAAAREASGLPVAAIGGINAENVAVVAAAGADMAAVIAAVFDAPDVADAARRIVRQFESATTARPDARAQPHAV